MQWTKPVVTEMRFGFEVTMYIMNRQENKMIQLLIATTSNRQENKAVEHKSY